MTDKAYKIYVTPLIDEMVYGDEIEISDYVKSSSLGTVKKNTDSDDYVIGEYLLGSANLTCANFNGEFNEGEPRSFFRYKRNDAKLRIVYYSNLTDSTISFKGLISDDGTTSGDDFIKLKVLALESILRTVQVTSIDTGTLFSDAIKSILNRTAIKAVLTYDENEIEVDLDLAIDDGGPFANISTWEALKLLLIASNSVVFIDDETIKVKTRDEDTEKISYFYGAGDTLDRENIINITNFNNGAHRVFNSIQINDTIYTDDTSSDWFGLNQKAFTLDFITDADKELIIATNLVNQFRYPRIEFQMTVNTDLANGVDFFDTIGVENPIRSKPCQNFDGSLWDTSLYDTLGDVYPVDFGGVTVDGRLAFQMIQRTENPKNFTTTLKLRGRGKTFDDGVLIFWQAIWDQSIYDISTW